MDGGVNSQPGKHEYPRKKSIQTVNIEKSPCQVKVCKKLTLCQAKVIKKTVQSNLSYYVDGYNSKNLKVDLIINVKDIDNLNENW